MSARPASARTTSPARARREQPLTTEAQRHRADNEELNSSPPCASVPPWSMLSAKNLSRRVQAACPHYAAARMGRRPAQVQALDRRPVVGVAGRRAEAEH